MPLPPPWFPLCAFPAALFPCFPPCCFAFPPDAAAAALEVEVDEAVVVVDADDEELDVEEVEPVDVELVVDEPVEDWVELLAELLDEDELPVEVEVPD